MPFCTSCGKELLADATFCVHCGTPITSETPVAEAPMMASPVCPAYTEEEREFLEWTNRFMRWERKARHIEGKVCLIVGIVLAAVMFTLALIGASAVSLVDEGAGFFFFFVYSTLAVELGGFLIAIGIVQRKIGEKMDAALAVFDTDCREALEQEGSVKRLIISIIFGTVSHIFSSLTLFALNRSVGWSNASLIVRTKQK